MTTNRKMIQKEEPFARFIETDCWEDSTELMIHNLEQWQEYLMHKSKGKWSAREPFYDDMWHLEDEIKEVSDEFDRYRRELIDAQNGDNSTVNFFVECHGESIREQSQKIALEGAIHRIELAKKEMRALVLRYKRYEDICGSNYRLGIHDSGWFASDIVRYEYDPNNLVDISIDEEEYKECIEILSQDFDWVENIERTEIAQDEDCSQLSEISVPSEEKNDASNHNGIEVKKNDLKKDEQGLRYIEINDQRFYVAADVAKIGGQKSYYVTRKVSRNNVFKSSGYRGGLMFVSVEGIEQFQKKTKINAYRDLKF